MKKTIFLCASMSFYRKLVDIERQLEEKGFTVIIPVSAQLMKESNDFEISHFKGIRPKEHRQDFIRTNFDNIIKSDYLLAINEEKNGIKGYIGPNVLMEIGLAFYKHKKIFILNPIRDDVSYEEELQVFDVEFINGDLDKIESYS